MKSAPRAPPIFVALHTATDLYSQAPPIFQKCFDPVKPHGSKHLAGSMSPIDVLVDHLKKQTQKQTSKKSFMLVCLSETKTEFRFFCSKIKLTFPATKLTL